MLTTFNALRERYASREITMEELGTLQTYGFVRFENRGISRSNTDCLLCEIYCEPLEAFLESACTKVFDSVADFRHAVGTSGLGLSESAAFDGESLFYGSEDGSVEMTAWVDEDGYVRLDMDDVEALPYFQVFLRVQGF